MKISLRDDNPLLIQNNGISKSSLQRGNALWHHFLKIINRIFFGAFPKDYGIGIKTSDPDGKAHKFFLFDGDIRLWLSQNSHHQDVAAAIADHDQLSRSGLKSILMQLLNDATGKDVESANDHGSALTRHNDNVADEEGDGDFEKQCLEAAEGQQRSPLRTKDDSTKAQDQAAKNSPLYDETNTYQQRKKVLEQRYQQRVQALQDQLDTQQTQSQSSQQQATQQLHQELNDIDTKFDKTIAQSDAKLAQIKANHNAQEQINQKKWTHKQKAHQQSLDDIDAQSALAKAQEQQAIADIKTKHEKTVADIQAQQLRDDAHYAAKNQQLIMLSRLVEQQRATAMQALINNGVSNTKQIVQNIDDPQQKLIPAKRDDTTTRRPDLQKKNAEINARAEEIEQDSTPTQIAAPTQAPASTQAAAPRPKIQGIELTDQEQKIYDDLCDHAANDPLQYTALHYLLRAAILSGAKEKLVLYALSQGADVNDQNNAFQLSPLHLSLEQNTFKLIKYFQIKDPKNDVNVKYCNLLKLNTSTIKILIDAQVDVNAKNIDGNTPLHLSTDPQTVDYLIANGADYNVANYKGKTPFQSSVERLICFPNNTEYFAIARLFAKKGAVLNDPPLLLKKTIESATTNISKDGYLPLAQFLIDQGTSLHSADPNDKLLRSTIQQAIKYIPNDKRYLALAQFLLDNSADLGNADPDGELLNSAVQHATKYISDVRYLALAQFLLDKGADLSNADPKDKLLTSVIQLATKYISDARYLTLAKFLLDNGADLSNADPDDELLKSAIQNATIYISDARYLALAQFLIDNGADLSNADSDGGLLRSAIQKATAYISDVRYLSLAQFLLKNGADINDADADGELLKDAAKKAQTYIRDSKKYNAIVDLINTAKNDAKIAQTLTAIK